MSDLISRNALLKQLLEAKDDEIIKAVIGLVQTQPTAYDVSKVIEELEEKQYQANKDMQISELYEDVQAYGGKYLAFGEAIEIVKAGGIDG